MNGALGRRRFGERWLELINRSPGFDVSLLMRNFKEILTRRIHMTRGGGSTIWSSARLACGVGASVDRDVPILSLIEEGPDA